MNNTRSKLEGIADIEPPLLPPESGTDIIVFGIIATLLLLYAAYLFWRYRYSLRGQARRKLTHLQQLLISTATDNRYAAFQLAAILRIGLNLQQVSDSTPLPARLSPLQTRWHTFSRTLHNARYSPADITDDDINNLLKDATFWLRRWP